MIDHVGLKVGDYQKSLAFYTKALKPLGYRPEYTDAANKTAGFGAKGAPDFWISEGTPMACVHIALRSSDRATVNMFHAAALSAGGKDNGGPGPPTRLRPHLLRRLRLGPRWQQHRAGLP